jgi:hypothetical protein
MTIALKELEGVARWVLQQEGDSAPFNVTQGFTAVGLAAAQNFVDEMVATWDANLQSATTEDVTLVEVNGLWFDGTNEHSLIADAGLVGTGGPGVLPSNCALLIKKQTAFAGRAFRGRAYWPSMLAEGDVDINGIIDGATVTALQTAFDLVFDDLDTAVFGAGPAVLHDKVTAGVVDPTEATPMTGFLVRNKIGTQRRRMRGNS